LIPISHLGAWRIKCESELHSFIPISHLRTSQRVSQSNQSLASQVQVKCKSELHSFIPPAISEPGPCQKVDHHRWVRALTSQSVKSEPGKSSASLKSIDRRVRAHQSVSEPASQIRAWQIKCKSSASLSSIHSFIPPAISDPGPCQKSIDRRVRAHQSVSQIRAWQVKCKSELRSFISPVMSSPVRQCVNQSVISEPSHDCPDALARVRSLQSVSEPVSQSNQSLASQVRV
jgi:hypothetical protein